MSLVSRAVRTSRVRSGRASDDSIAEFLQARYEVVIPDYAYNEYGYGP